jgi:putative membrane protein insertion efficiency factor
MNKNGSFVRKFFLKPIKWYQYFTKFTPSSCRYYPTCSEYARWLFLFDTPISATLKTSKRVLSCNQLFIGGIDYPKIKYKPPKYIMLCNIIRGIKLQDNNKYLKIKDKERKIRIQFWLIPDSKGYYFIVKDFNATATYIPARYASASTARGDVEKGSTPKL